MCACECVHIHIYTLTGNISLHLKSFLTQFNNNSIVFFVIVVVDDEHSTHVNKFIPVGITICQANEIEIVFRLSVFETLSQNCMIFSKY